MFSEHHGNRISDLPHGFRPWPSYLVIVRKSLNALAFKHREVAHRTIVVPNHVFSAGNTMTTRLHGFGGQVIIAAGVAGIRSRQVTEDVIGAAMFGSDERQPLVRPN